MKKFLLLLTLFVITLFVSLSTFAQYGVHNGHHYVDLALPSGTKWADYNVGASSPTQFGNYYAWGETNTKSDYNWDTYKYIKLPTEKKQAKIVPEYSDSAEFFSCVTKYCSESECGKDGFTDFKKELDLADDLAHKLWGGKWRIPSDEQFDELINYTKHRWTRINSVIGMLFIGRNGYSIFLPAAGSCYGTSLKDGGSSGGYWSRTLSAYASYSACFLKFDLDDVWEDVYVYRTGYRYDGHTVRPVCL